VTSEAAPLGQPHEVFAANHVRRRRRGESATGGGREAGVPSQLAVLAPGATSGRAAPSRSPAVKAESVPVLAVGGWRAVRISRRRPVRPAPAVMTPFRSEAREARLLGTIYLRPRLHRLAADEMDASCERMPDSRALLGPWQVAYARAARGALVFASRRTGPDRRMRAATGWFAARPENSLSSCGV